MAFTNSPLVSYTNLCNDYSKGRYHKTHNPDGKVKKITIHHMAGNLSIEKCGELFATSPKDVSSTYGVGTDGRIGLYVEEKNRPWTSSSAANDWQAVTIEVANDKIGGDWHVSDKALAATIDLCVDICKRNDIKKLNFTGDKTGNLTMHKYFAATACPGAYLESKFPYIAEEVNKRLTAETKKDLYRVRKSWGNAKSQVGAYTSLENAKNGCPVGYTVYNSKGEAVYSNTVTTVKTAIAEGDKVKLTAKAVIYGTDKKFQDWVYKTTLYVREINYNRVVISTQKTGAVTGAVDKKYLTKA